MRKKRLREKVFIIPNHSYFNSLSWLYDPIALGASLVLIIILFIVFLAAMIFFMKISNKEKIYEDEKVSVCLFRVEIYSYYQA